MKHRIIRRTTYLNYIKFADLLIVRLYNCERVCRVWPLQARKQKGRAPPPSLSLLIITCQCAVWACTKETVLVKEGLSSPLSGQTQSDCGHVAEGDFLAGLDAADGADLLAAKH